MEQETFFISEASELTGLEPHVLRYWEDELGIPVLRNSQGKRCYTQQNIDYFLRAKRLKGEGLQLRAVRELLCAETEREYKRTEKECAAAEEHVIRYRETADRLCQEILRELNERDAGDRKKNRFQRIKNRYRRIREMIQKIY